MIIDEKLRGGILKCSWYAHCVLFTTSGIIANLQGSLEIVIVL